jgi:hypothetical protein
MDKGGPVSWTPLRGGRRDGRGEKRRQCSIGHVKRLLAVLLGGLGLRALFRRRPASIGGPDPARELRAKLDETRPPVAEVAHEPEAEVPPEPEPEPAPGPEPGSESDAADQEPQDVPTRRAEVHDRARQAIDDLKR